MEVVDNDIFSSGGGNANLYYYNGNQLHYAENVTNGYYYEIERNSLALGGIVKLQQEKIEELRLHLIEKDKAIFALKRKVRNRI